MQIKEMDPELIKKILESQEDLLSPLVKAEHEILKNVTCPDCGSNESRRSVNPTTPFSNGAATPNYIFKCLKCSTEYSPKSGIILKPKPTL